MFFKTSPSELPWLENISIYDPLPNQHVNIKQESSREPLKACKTLDFSFVFTPSHFLFLPLQLFEIISFPYKSELPQIRGQLLFSCINLNFNYRAHMNIIFKKDVSVFHIVACLYISSGILVFLGEPVLSVSPNIENISCQIKHLSFQLFFTCSLQLDQEHH